MPKGPEYIRRQNIEVYWFYADIHPKVSYENANFYADDREFFHDHRAISPKPRESSECLHRITDARDGLAAFVSNENTGN